MKKKEDNTIPTPTATNKSTNTVKIMARISTKESLFFSLISLFIPLKSIIPIPTEIKSADRTDFGTMANILPKPRIAIIRKTPFKIPLKFDLPLELIFATVAAVVPAPGIPPKTPVKKFPNPCPNNSLFPLCLVLVRLSATTDVSRVSIVPKPAKASAFPMAKLTISESTLASISNNLNSGNVVGISPIVLKSP